MVAGISVFDVLDQWEKEHCPFEERFPLYIELTSELIQEARQWAVETIGENSRELSNREVVELFIDI